ncbi:UDP-N-acetylmuramoyl-L-alanine--D-glutamate ligase [soil metagenome]
MELSGKRVTVMGLGTRGGGIGVARFLVEAGSIVTVTDGKNAEDLAVPLAELDDLPITYVLGEHRVNDFTKHGADLVVRNPAVRRWSPWLQLARESGIPVEMEMSLFLKLAPGPVIGITGTKGKTTTAALCGEILKKWRSDTVVAGNMGVSAVTNLPSLTADTPVVIEISNWQLEGLLEHQVGPQIAVLTNISEDHLDTYDSFDDYAGMKRSIARCLQPDDIFIVNADDPESWKAVHETRAKVVGVSTTQREGGVCAHGQSVIWNLDDHCGSASIPDHPWFRGDALRHNVCAAVCAAVVRGATIEAVEEGLSAFAGVENRSELVAEIDGIRFINDTSATAPAAVVSAMNALEGDRAHVIAGGADKKSDLSPLADILAERAETITLLEGSATSELRRMLLDRNAQLMGVHHSMESAIAAAVSVAEPGDTVILSPGCASFGLFQDEFDRGAQFRSIVLAIAATRKSS